MMKMVLKLLIMADIWLSILNLKNVEHLQKKDLNEESTLIAWHPRRWWNLCMSEDNKKDLEPIFTE